MSREIRAGHEFILTVSCVDTPGLVFAVSSYLIQHNGNILQSQQFDDRASGAFFMRVHFDVPGGAVLDALRAGFAHVAGAFRMTWQLADAATPTRTLIMVSRFGHCLNDLLYRQSTAVSTWTLLRSSPITPISATWPRRTAFRFHQYRSRRTPRLTPRLACWR